MQKVERTDRQRHRAIAISAMIATFMTLAFGIGYRVVAARLAAPVNAVSIDPAVLAQLPMELGEWTGQDTPMDEATVRATDTDGYVNRRYSRYGGAENVGLYIAYGVRARELMPHRPEVCYPCAGWTRTDRRSMDLPVSDEVQLPCGILQFSRGVLATRKVLILNYYIVDGQYSPDVSLLRSNAWRGPDTSGYAAQVQIVAPVTENISAGSAEKMVCDFAAESASSIFRLFESAGETEDDSDVTANHDFGETGSG